jgi:teichuronic acid biosynthesis glycosyltransferase TuaG
MCKDMMVSIITPCFNVSCYLSETIRSVQSQTTQDWELLLVDDGSTDNTRQICEDASRIDPRIRAYGLGTNQGAGAARNYAISRARGRFIAFLDGDDLWYPHKLEAQLDVFQKMNVAITYASYDLIDQEGNDMSRRIVAPPTVRYSDLLKGCPIGCLTAVYDTRAVGKVYMPPLKKRQDWGLWLRILYAHDHAMGLSDSLAALRLRNESLSANKLQATYYTWRLLREEAGLGVVRASLGTLRHVAAAARRRLGLG